jgi:beta-glucosidase
MGSEAIIATHGHKRNHEEGMSMRKYSILSAAVVLAMLAAYAGGSGNDDVAAEVKPWMDTKLAPEKRAQLLVSAMTLEQKQQQATGAMPEILPDLPECYGGRHVTGIAALNIPALRITNGPVGLGQNDCVAASLAADVAAGKKGRSVAYGNSSSAKATALPSAMSVAASFDTDVATAFGDLIGTEMNNLALHVFEAPGVNIARLPILGRNFEYFGEDPYLAGVMGVAEVKAVQARGLIGMAKHFVANEQETNRLTIQESIDRQVLREIYLLPFEMAVKDGKTASVMCAYNYVNGVSSCENKEHLTDILRADWGFTGYVQSDFFAMKTTAATMLAGLDHEMPTPTFWSTTNLNAALAVNSLKVADLDTALTRRYTQMFKAGIFDRALKQTAIDYAAGGVKARDIGVRSAVLLQNNGTLPIAATVQNVVVIGKSTQVYAQQAVAGGVMVGQPMGAGGGSSDVVPQYTVAPVNGIRNALKILGNSTATVKLILVDDANSAATIDSASTPFAAAMAAAAGADAVIVMAGTIAEEGADRATFTGTDGKILGAGAAGGSSLDWYAARPSTIATTISTGNLAKSSNTVAMIQAIMAAVSTTSRSMVQKTVLVLKDNAGVSMDPALVGAAGPAILEVWFPGQEDGDIVADLLFGVKNPSGKLPVTFPIAGKGFLDNITAVQFPGVIAADGKQTVEYTEKLNIGYRWYDANVSGQCAVAANRSNPCVAFPFGHGLSYTTFTVTAPRVALNSATRKYDVRATVKNTGSRTGAEAVQVYVSLPAAANAYGAAQPPKRLIGFQKVELAAGASKQVTISIDPSASHHPLSVWSQADRKWMTAAGTYTVYVGNSSSFKDLIPVTFTR